MECHQATAGGMDLIGHISLAARLGTTELQAKVADSKPWFVAHREARLDRWYIPDVPG